METKHTYTPEGFLWCQKTLQQYGGDAYHLETEEQSTYVMDDGHKTTYHASWFGFLRAYSAWCDRIGIIPF